jgi:diguanylate cyclase (GGDEF)-like protein/putative nucleotidyltransferase with HDIG domain
LSLLMADLDLLRDVNNTYGHLAGDAVLTGVADVFRAELRHYDVPARFGGEEFSILLPETPREQALEIAERIRRAVEGRAFEVDTCSEPIRATVSIGVATFPADGEDGNGLMHQADLAVYRAKMHGRNQVMEAGSDVPPPRKEPPAASEAAPQIDQPVAAAPPSLDLTRTHEQRLPRPHTVRGPRFLTTSGRLALLVGLVTLVGVGAGVAGALLGASNDVIGLLAILALVGGAQTLALQLDDASISVTAAGALAAAAVFGPRAALAVAATTAVVEWSSRRSPLHQVLFNVGSLSLASLSAAGVFATAAHAKGGSPQLLCAAAGLVAGATYFAVNTGLLSLALATEGHERWLRVWRERFAWLLPHYVVYGFVGAAIAIAYHAGGLYALAVFILPLLLMRKAQAAYLAHTQRSVQKLRTAAATIKAQNVSLEQANRLLKERSTKAMESLSATVDARDSYTAGHSRRVQQFALAIGRELDLSQAELEVLGYAALFHDVGKLAVPDAILLKPTALTGEEWTVMQRHSEEGARIIERLGFLHAAVPAIRHHHERWDGTGYPDRLIGEQIPLGARIIHVADALDSMLTTRTYRGARPTLEALAEIRYVAGSQFCPRCVAAVERALPTASIEALSTGRPLLRVAS